MSVIAETVKVVFRIGAASTLSSGLLGCVSGPGPEGRTATAAVATAVQQMKEVTSEPVTPLPPLSTLFPVGATPSPYGRTPRPGCWDEETFEDDMEEVGTQEGQERVATFVAGATANPSGKDPCPTRTPTASVNQ